jgi:hypothetical protein
MNTEAMDPITRDTCALTRDHEYGSHYYAYY